MTTFAAPFGNGGIEKLFQIDGFQIFHKKFADSRKVTTFATPFGNGGIEKLFYNIGFQIF